ncbi:MAG: hypothetical protein AAGD38_07710 [Acidobacteriota bacterium]
MHRCGGDATLRNLRLLYVRSREPDDRWRELELEHHQSVRVADHVGGNDLPALAARFVVLRTIGLVRHQHGQYQVALPVDHGVVPNPSFGGDARDPHSSRYLRRRFYTWHDLAPDPIDAAERLFRKVEKLGALDLFVSPLINRVWQGHSPRLLFDALRRCAALLEGRDPSPWPWLRRAFLDTDTAGNDLRAEVVERSDGGVELSAENEQELADRFQAPMACEEGFEEALDGWVEPPLERTLWRTWHHKLRRSEELPKLTIALQKPFIPAHEDGPAMFRLDRRILDMRNLREAERAEEAPLLVELLGYDWEAAGWAAGELDAPVFDILPLSAFRLGLFDHDPRPQDVESLQLRLAELGRLARQGFARMWVDLRQERVEETTLSLLDERRRDHGDEALLQSLELLRNLIIEPLTGNVSKVDPEPAATESESGAVGVVDRDKPAPLPEEPSIFLRTLSIDGRGESHDVATQLENRLESLGIGDAAEHGEPWSLLHSAEIDPEVIKLEAKGADESETAKHLAALRQLLNRIVRELLDVHFLTEYRTKPIRRPPRLTIFVTGDMGEPFVRAVFRILLREVHAEPLRAFTPIFESFREGLDRSLANVPHIWMPHPADPFEGAAGEQRRRQREEGAIINAIQDVRRWVESFIPLTRRRVTQIFVNSRVTDLGVLAFRDAARQTRDFVALEIRNPIHEDRWLRRIATGVPGEDLFASFSCYEIELPGEKAREYLGNRLARELLTRVRGERIDSSPEIELPVAQPPRREAVLGEARAALRRRTEEEANRLGQSIESTVDASTTAEMIEKRFGEHLRDRLRAELQRIWEGMANDTGLMDRFIDELRRNGRQALVHAIDEVRERSDRLVENLTATSGLRAVLATLNQLADETRKFLVRSESQRRDDESEVGRQPVPDADTLDGPLAGLRQVAAAKPDLDPMRLGWVVWTLLAFSLAGPLLQMLALAFELHEQPNVLEPALGPFAPVTAGVILAVLGGLYLRYYMDRMVRRVRQAIDGFREAVASLVRGPADSEGRRTPSLRSFFDTRLALAATLVDRGYALRVHERALGDRALGRRMVRSVDVQLDRLHKQAEDLGVRPAFAVDEENLDGLFAGRDGQSLDTLVSPDAVAELFIRRFTSGRDLDREVPALIAATGGLSRWRAAAVLADTRAILATTRRHFTDLVDQTAADQHQLRDEIGRRLVEFVAKLFANIGFGAKFIGSEGLDPDGMQVLADAALVLHPDLEVVFETARGQSDLPVTTRTMRVVPCHVRPNAAYMLSLAQGLRPHIIRNLRRYESFHERTFALLGYEPTHLSDGAAQRIDHFTSYRDVIEMVVEQGERRSRANDVEGSR